MVCNFRFILMSVIVRGYIKLGWFGINESGSLLLLAFFPRMATLFYSLTKELPV